MESSHSIYIPDMDIHIPLKMKGVILCYESHKPSADELENCWQIVMTSDAPWDPYDPVFTDQEQAAAYKAKISAVVRSRTGTMMMMAPVILMLKHLILVILAVILMLNHLRGLKSSNGGEPALRADRTRWKHSSHQTMT